MSCTKGEVFFDTNILCYAYDLSEPAKREVCEDLVEKAFSGSIRAVVSNQVLVELHNAFTRKLGVPATEAAVIVRSISVSENWSKVNYTHNTVNNALRSSRLSDAPFLDALIAETMREYGISEIITEDEKHFKRFSDIVVRQPFV